MVPIRRADQLADAIGVFMVLPSLTPLLAALSRPLGGGSYVRGAALANAIPHSAILPA